LRGTGRVTDNPVQRTAHASHDESPTRRCVVMKYYVGLSTGAVEG